ncbi:MAG TPA: MspA protein [Mycobacterium sp.]|nr:MspA protein [Mycobacterium sp.]
MFGLVAVLAAATALLMSSPPASADPVPADPDVATPIAATAAPAATPPAADGRVASNPPSTSTLEGVTLTISAKNETQMPVLPLTTAISTREYVVGGVFSGSITGSAAPAGTFEVGYQIGCGIDMSTGGGVLVGGNVQGALGADLGIAPVPPFVIPIAGGGLGVNGTLGVNLKPGIINTVPVTKKAYKGAAPEVEISMFRVRIDGCVGESFIRSYATLANSAAEIEDIVSWFGITKAV